MGNKFVPGITTKGQLNSISIVNGQLLATSDTLELFIDNNGVRNKYSDIVFGTYSSITNNATPLTDKIYFATDTHQLLQATYNGASVTWTELGGSGEGGSSTLAGLTDVTISSPTSGQALVYNGSGWVNGSTAGSGGTKVVTKGGNISLQAVTDFTPYYAGDRGNAAVDLQQVRNANTQVASGYCSVVMGGYNTASSYFSVAIGHYNTASGDSSVAMGESNTASGYSSVAMGGGNTASGDSSVAMGKVNIASGKHSVALGGSGNISEGSYSSVLGGENNTASGKHSVALGGNDNKAKANNVVVSGDKAIGSIEGAVCNNNRLIGYYAPANAFYQNTAGHCGFKGIRIPIDSNLVGRHTYTSIFNFELTDVAILRVNIINSTENTYGIFDLVITNCYLTQRIPVYQNLESNVNDIFDMIGSKLCMRRHLGNEYQIGIFYTIFRQGSEEGQSSSSSSSES